MEIRFDQIKPIKFHKYPSYVVNPIFSCEYNEETEYIRRELLEIFQAKNDNKIVFECYIQGNTIFIGFHDLEMYIGFQCRTERYCKINL